MTNPAWITHLLRNIFANPDVECILRAKRLQLNLTDTVKTVPFRGETERITKMMWPPAMQQHPGASLRFQFMARQTESPNDVTTSYATASRCITITMVPFCGETDRIATCRYKILRPVSHPPNVHGFVGTARTNGAVPLHLNNWNDCKIPKIKGNHPWQSVHELEVLHLFRCSTHTHALQKEAFRHRNSTAFSPESFYTEAFAQRCLYKQKLLHTEAFTQRSL